MITIIENYNLIQNNTFRISANCKKWLEYTSVSDLYLIAEEVSSNKFFSIGEGSNILFTQDYDGTILHSRIIDMNVNIDDNGDLLVRCGAGIKLDDIISYCCSAKRWGFENLSGIPGNVGASVVQNVGAYGVEIKDLVEEVECFDMNKKEYVILSNDMCKFAYRHSIFKEYKTAFVVTHVTYRLKKMNKPYLEYGNLKEVFSQLNNITPNEVRKEIISIRDMKLPSIDKIGSAGSFFKNPILSETEFRKIKQRHEEYNITGVSNIPHFQTGAGNIKIPAAWLIEQCGFKGISYGNAGVWEKQPLVLINRTGKASAQEIINLENLIRDTVYSKYEIILEPEVEHI